MFGFGERKIKINQLPEEKTETKPQSKTEQKLTYTEKVIAPSEASRLRNILPSVVRIAYGNFRIWRKRVRRLR